MINIDLEAMKNLDLMTVDPSTLYDIQNVSINGYLPKLERMKQYIEQIGNPYFYKCDDTVIKIGNIKTERTINDGFNSLVFDM